MPATTIAAVRARRVFDSRGRPMRAPDGGVVYRSAQIANAVNLRLGVHRTATVPRAARPMVTGESGCVAGLLCN